MHVSISWYGLYFIKIAKIAKYRLYTYLYNGQESASTCIPRRKSLAIVTLLRRTGNKFFVVAVLRELLNWIRVGQYI
jgi:hypothetical protein